MPIAFDDILAAARRIRGGIYHSPCPPSEPLSLVAGCQVYCKLDYLQRTGSFKERGARNALLLLTEEERRRGVAAASAGNHALGLAYHGKGLGVPVTVVMPRFAPFIKVNACRQLGTDVILHGETFDEARTHALALAQERGLRFVHAFDDPAVIAGQGSMGLEIAEQVPDLDAVIVPIGGGGLLAGLGTALKHLRPHVKIIGVEPAHAACFSAALAAGAPVTIAIQPTLADGLAVARAGEQSFAAARPVVDRVVTVDERAIALAILRLMELEKGVVEGAGAAPLAACLAGLVPELAGRKVVLPLCGGNIDLTLLGHILERGLVADGRLARFTARVSDRPGGIARLAALIAAQGVSIMDIHHDRRFSGADLNAVNVRFIVQTSDQAHIRRLRDHLLAEGLDVDFEDLKGR